MKPDTDTPMDDETRTTLKEFIDFSNRLDSPTEEFTWTDLASMIRSYANTFEDLIDQKASK